MTWAKFDDRYPEGKKVRRLSDKAFRLDVTGICYSAAHNSDGIIEYDADVVARKKGVVAELVRSGRWHTPETYDACEGCRGDHPRPAEGDWLIHGFLEYNPSKKEVDSKRHNKRIAGAIGAAKRWGKAEPNAPVPTRPDPSRPEELGFDLDLESTPVVEGGVGGGWELTPDMAALLASLPRDMASDLMQTLGKAVGDFGAASATEALRVVRSTLDAGTPISKPTGFFWHHAARAFNDITEAQ